MLVLNGAEEVKPIFISPSSPSCARRATSAALSTWASTSRASSRNSRPAEFDPTIGTLEQPCAQLLLQRLDLLAQWRLGDAQLLCGAAEVQFLGDGDEVAQVTQFHVEHRLGRFRYQTGRMIYWMQSLATYILSFATFLLPSR